MTFKLSRDFLRWYFGAWERLGRTNIINIIQWLDALGDLAIAIMLLPILLPLVVIDLVEWVVTSAVDSVGQAMTAAEAKYRLDHADELRIAEAERARQAWNVDLQIAASIDDPDTRDMAVQHANNKYHRRLADIMGE